MCDSNGRVDAILMASGFSRRFGTQNKLLASFCGRPLLTRTLDLVCKTHTFDHVFLTAADPAVRALAEGYSFSVLWNEHPERGARESVRLGVSASEADYFLFITCDQPLLDETTLRGILALRKPGAIVQPVFQGQPGSPVLFSSHFRAELAGLLQGEHAKEVILRHPDAVVRMELLEEKPLWDVDRPEDIQRLELYA